MNERIQECWLKAAREDAGETWDSQEQFIERFAELIVRECIEQFALSVTDNTKIIQDRFTQCRKVAKHFGVEE